MDGNVKKGTVLYFTKEVEMDQEEFAVSFSKALAQKQYSAFPNDKDWRWYLGKNWFKVKREFYSGNSYNPYARGRTVQKGDKTIIHVKIDGFTTGMIIYYVIASGSSIIYISHTDF